MPSSAGSDQRGQGEAAAKVAELEASARRVIEWHRNNGGFDKNGLYRCDSENCEFDELNALLSAQPASATEHPCAVCHLLTCHDCTEFPRRYAQPASEKEQK